MFMKGEHKNSEITLLVLSKFLTKSWQQLSTRSLPSKKMPRKWKISFFSSFALPTMASAFPLVIASCPFFPCVKHLWFAASSLYLYWEPHSRCHLEKKKREKKRIIKKKQAATRECYPMTLEGHFTCYCTMHVWRRLPMNRQCIASK